MELVSAILGLVSSAAHYGIDNAVAIGVGVLIGGPILGAGLGVVTDLLGRAQGLAQDV